MNREITLMDFFRFVLSKMKLILIFGCIAAILAAGFTLLTAKTSYNYTGSFIVDPFSNVDDSFTSNNVYNELTISRSIIPSLVELLERKDFAGKVAKIVNKKMKKYDTNIDANYITNNTRYITNDDSLMIDFRCTSSSKELAYTIASTISEIAPQYVSSKFNRTNLNPVETISKDEFGTTKTDFKVWAVVAFFIAAVMTTLVSLVIELLDNRIKTIEDVTEHFEYPILGTIPDFYTHIKKEGYYGKPEAKKTESSK